MTEVFDSWIADRLQRSQQQLPSPNAPQAQLHRPLQQSAYVYNHLVAELPYVPALISLASPPLTPNTPLSGYPSPALPQTAPNIPYLYHPPPQGAIELPDNACLAAPAPVPTRSISTEVSRLAPLTFAL